LNSFRFFTHFDSVLWLYRLILFKKVHVKCISCIIIWYFYLILQPIDLESVTIQVAVNAAEQVQPKQLENEESELSANITFAKENNENNATQIQDVSNKETSEEFTITKPYYEPTHLLMSDNLQQLLGCIESWLSKTEASDFEKVKHMFGVVIKLLKTLKEIHDTTQALHGLERFFCKRFESSDEEFRFWTGMYSYQGFMLLWRHYVEPNCKDIYYWKNKNDSGNNKCGPKRKLVPIDELFLTLVKLKQASANRDIAERFKIHHSQVSIIFITWIRLLRAVLCSIDIWLSKRKIRQTMPECFKRLYGDVRVIVDCTELKSERPSDFDVQCATYSSYKGCNTHKALVGISPSGIPTFVSELYEGSISDNNITNQSKLRELLQPGDAMMADRGWTCANWLAKKGVRLITPHFLQGNNQLTLPEIVESVAIARVRIHVERCMGRIKQWHFLKKEIPLTYWNMVSDVFQVCAYLILFWPPLIDDDDDHDNGND